MLVQFLADAGVRASAGVVGGGPSRLALPPSGVRDGWMEILRGRRKEEVPGAVGGEIGVRRAGAFHSVRLMRMIARIRSVSAAKKILIQL
jgi:hypothetical protein